MRYFTPAFITIRIFILLIVISLFSCKTEEKEMELTRGMYITESVKIKAGEYLLTGADSLDQPVITIEGDNIVVDFNGAILKGSTQIDQPDQFSGLGVLIKKGKNIQIINAVVSGYKVALMANEIDSLQIIKSNFSYNYRQHLKSNPDMEDLSDWLSYHHNENDEWLRYGAAIYLKACDHALVKDVLVTGGQNGLLLVQCNNGLFYNNKMNYNSGLGLGMYRSSQNRILHNKFDWCIRGYSHGIYNRGQDSAGILAYEQSNENTFAYNSATHSGDGFFLWAGQTFMDSGTGACIDNLVYANDFSHASNNGVEITFSKNKIINNRLEDCHYGVWGGYSYGSIIAGNRFKDNTHDVAFEHGNNNVIYANRMEGSDVGVQLWERPVQPKSWGFVTKRDIRSREYTIDNNLFVNVKTPLKIEATSNAKMRENQFFDFEQLLKAGFVNENFTFVKNSIYQSDLLGDATAYSKDNALMKSQSFQEMNPADFVKEYHVKPLSDGMSTKLATGTLRGRKYMLITEWGPYNFEYPTIWLRGVDGDQYTFVLFGPEGNWKVVGGEGFESLSAKTGAMPATLVATKEAGADPKNLKIKLEFIGQGFNDQFGVGHEKGREYGFEWALAVGE